MSDALVHLGRRIIPAVVDFIQGTGPEYWASHWASPADTEAQFDALARELFAVQYVLNQPFQSLCRSRAVSPDTLRNWTEIPAVPTAAFKELEVTCLPEFARSVVFYSSGTTGASRGRHFHSLESLAVYRQSALPWFKAHVLGEDRDAAPEGNEELRDPIGGAAPAFLALTPPAAVVPHSSLVFMLDAAVREFGARDSVFAGRLDATQAWELDGDRVLFALRKSMCANRPLCLLGTAYNFVQLLDFLAAGNIRYRLAAGSRILETGGYKGRTRVVPKPELHALLTRHLGIPATRIGCEYGMCELSSQAYDQPGGAQRPLSFPPWARVRVVSPENGRAVPDGQPGVITILDLANVGSVAAVQTEDLGIRWPDGRFELLGRIESAEPKGCSLN